MLVVEIGKELVLSKAYTFKDISLWLKTVF